MANEQTTPIGAQLDRIERAKEVLVEKAKKMALTVVDENDNRIAISDEYNAIDEVARAFNAIEIRGSHTMTVDGPKVIVPYGYYPYNEEKVIDGIDRAETTIEVSEDMDTGAIEIVAKNDQKTGYVTEDDTKDMAEVDLVFEVEGDVAKLITANDVVVAQRAVDPGSYIAGVSMWGGSGNVSAESKGDRIVQFTEHQTEVEADGPYIIKVTGSGQVYAKGEARITQSGYLITEDPKTTAETNSYSEPADLYLKLKDVRFKNGNGEEMSYLSIDPINEEEITFTDGYTEGGKVAIGGNLLARLQAI